MVIDRRANDHVSVHVYLCVDDVCIFGLINNTIITTFINCFVASMQPWNLPPPHPEDTSTSECVVVVVNDAAALQRVYIIVINRYVT